MAAAPRRRVLLLVLALAASSRAQWTLSADEDAALAVVLPPMPAPRGVRLRAEITPSAFLAQTSARCDKPVASDNGYWVSGVVVEAAQGGGSLCQLMGASVTVLCTWLASPAFAPWPRPQPAARLAPPAAPRSADSRRWRVGRVEVGQAWLCGPVAGAALG